MPVELVEKKPRKALPVHLVRKDGLETAGLSPQALAWAKANGFLGEAGKTLVLPGKDGELSGALFGHGEGSLQLGALAKALPEGDWHFADVPADPELAALALALGGYVFTRYGKKPGKALRFVLPAGADAPRVASLVEAVQVAVRGGDRACYLPASRCPWSPSTLSRTSSTHRPATWARKRWNRPCGHWRAGTRPMSR